MPASWMPSYEELKGIVPLSWPFVEHGLVRGFMAASVAVCFCLDEVARKGTSDKRDVALLSAEDDDAVLRSVADMVSDDERRSGDVQRQWMHVLLWQCCSHEHDADELLAWVEIIYAEFDYPIELAPFVRYMPAKGKGKLPKDLVQALKTYLVKWKNDRLVEGEYGVVKTEAW